MAKSSKYSALREQLDSMSKMLADMENKGDSDSDTDADMEYEGNKDMDDGGQEDVDDTEPEIEDFPDSEKKLKEGGGKGPDLGVKGEGPGTDPIQEGGTLGKEKKLKLLGGLLKAKFAKRG